jgi:hypothetical protein
MITKYLLSTLGAKHSSFHFDIPNLLSFTVPCLPLATNVYIAVVLTIHQIFQLTILRVRIFTHYTAFDTYHSKFNSRFAMAGDNILLSQVQRHGKVRSSFQAAFIDVTDDFLEQTLLLLPSLMFVDKCCGGSQRLFGLIAIEV